MMVNECPSDQSTASVSSAATSSILRNTIRDARSSGNSENGAQHGSGSKNGNTSIGASRDNRNSVSSDVMSSDIAAETTQSNYSGGGQNSTTSSEKSISSMALPHSAIGSGVFPTQRTVQPVILRTAAAAAIAVTDTVESRSNVERECLSDRTPSVRTSESPSTCSANSTDTAAPVPCTGSPVIVTPLYDITSIVYKASLDISSLELLECAICTEPVESVIYQCKEGHVLCDECHNKVDVCPVCRSGPVDIRCRLLEEILKKVDNVTCKYAKNGCRQTVKYSTKKEHELRCSHRPFPCLHSFSGCKFEGSPDDLVAHLVANHCYEQHFTNILSFTCQKPNVRVILTGDENEQFVWQKNIYSCFDKHFILRIHRKVDFDPQFYVSVAVLHNRHHSNRYTVSTSGNHRKYTFEGPVWSIRKGFREIERVRDCLILPENIALFLSGGKGSENDLAIINLSITGEILPP